MSAAGDNTDRVIQDFIKTLSKKDFKVMPTNLYKQIEKNIVDGWEPKAILYAIIANGVSIAKVYRDLGKDSMLFNFMIDRGISNTNGDKVELIERLATKGEWERLEKIYNYTNLGPYWGCTNTLLVKSAQRNKWGIFHKVLNDYHPIDYWESYDDAIAWFGGHSQTVALGYILNKLAEYEKHEQNSDLVRAICEAREDAVFHKNYKIVDLIDDWFDAMNYSYNYRDDKDL